MRFDLPSIRALFPALQRTASWDTPPVFLDNPGGTQAVQMCLDRMNAYLVEHNANHGGAFSTSQASDRVLDEARLAMADFYNAARVEEIIFGNNMTTLTFHISRSLARSWQAGDSIAVTRLDHDANITPWVLAAQERGVQVVWVDFNPADGTLDLASLQAALDRRPRLLACGYASNALGTINPVKMIVQMAHAAGALVYIDAVQYAPHGPIDVQELDCDFLVSSAYKFFGPHAGILYGRQELLEDLFAYKVRPASNDLPWRFETGTQNHEGIAGILGAVEYLAWVGETFGEQHLEADHERYQGRRLHLKQAMTAIRDYEYQLSQAVLDVLEETPGVTIYGITDRQRLPERVPTFSFNLKGWHPRQLAERLARENIYAWDGNYYALAVTERLGVEEGGGMLRVGAVHYNMLEEIHRFGERLSRLALPG
jgi:cysteine desulfurase family protein (TIGR01976 family)